MKLIRISPKKWINLDQIISVEVTPQGIILTPVDEIPVVIREQAYQEHFEETVQGLYDPLLSRD